MYGDVIKDLDSPVLAAEAIATLRDDLLRLGGEKLALAAHWVDLHPGDETSDPGASVSRLRISGAEGTPEVDEVTAAYAVTLTPGRYFALVEAKIIEVDPAAAEARAEARALERFVRTGQSDEHGLKVLVAKANAGDIIYLVAVIDRIAATLL